MTDNHGGVKPHGLKPCPFCGGSAAMSADGRGWRFVQCEVCRARGPAHPPRSFSGLHMPEGIAARWWNFRPNGGA